MSCGQEEYESRTVVGTCETVAPGRGGEKDHRGPESTSNEGFSSNWMGPGRLAGGRSTSSPCSATMVQDISGDEVELPNNKARGCSDFDGSPGGKNVATAETIIHRLGC
jgi:hypothetical protein